MTNSTIYTSIGGVIGAFIGASVIYAYFLVRAPYRQRNEARQFVKDLQANKPPKNVDSLIGAFTDLGERAKAVITAHHAYASLRDAPAFLMRATRSARQEVERAECAYHEAQIKTQVEINVAGGMLSRWLMLIMADINSNVKATGPQGPDANYPFLEKAPGIYTSVQAALACIRTGAMPEAWLKPPGPESPDAPP